MKYFLTIFLVAIAIFGCNAKRYEECELAIELVQHGFAKSSLKDWICLIKSESSMDTRAMNPTNSDGSRDYGLFQINDRYWCQTSGTPSSNICGFDCKGEFDQFNLIEFLIDIFLII